VGHGLQKEIEITQRYSQAFNGRDLKVNGKGVPLRSQAEGSAAVLF